MDASVDDTVGADDCDVDLTMSEVPIDSPDVSASLPPPDQFVRRDSSARSLSNAAPKNSRKCLWIVVAGVALLALILGLSLGLTGNSQDTNKSVQEPEPRKAQFDQAVAYFVDNGVSSVDAMRNAASPQAKAIVWLTELDDRNLPVPPHPISSTVGYHYLTRYVLAVIYFSLSGEDWALSPDWLSGKDFCHWNLILRAQTSSGDTVDLPFGCECDKASQKIVAIRLYGNQLKGAIPQELGYLGSLQILSLQMNSLQGGFPKEVCSFSDLTALSLRDNELIGEIPECVSNLTQLQYLLLSSNEFSGPIPEFSQMKDMVWLGLDNNTKLTGNVTGVLDGMTRLVLLHLDDTGLSGHVDHNFLKGCANLTQLDLSGAGFHGGFPSHLLELPSLQVLDLHDNKLHGSLPEEIKSNSALQFIALNGNQLNGTIPDSISNLKSLFHLDLSYNQFDGTMPIALSNLTLLQRLYLSENRFSSGAIPPEFRHLSLLRELSLKNTFRTGPIPTFLGDLQKLKLLDLDNNKFNGTVPTQLGGLPDLEFLLLNRNEGLEGPIPDSFGQLSTLRGIFLDRTNLNGSLNVLCNLDTFKESAGDADGKEIITADCAKSDATPAEIDCACCTTCCSDDDEDSCHDYDEVTNLDPEWQYGYDRVDFQFGDSAYFQDRSYIGG